MPINLEHLHWLSKISADRLDPAITVLINELEKKRLTESKQIEILKLINVLAKPLVDEWRAFLNLHYLFDETVKLYKNDLKIDYKFIEEKTSDKKEEDEGNLCELGAILDAAHKIAEYEIKSKDFSNGLMMWVLEQTTSIQDTNDQIDGLKIIAKNRLPNIVNKRVEEELNNLIPIKSFTQLQLEALESINVLTQPLVKAWCVDQKLPKPQMQISTLGKFFNASKNYAWKKEQITPLNESWEEIAHLAQFAKVILPEKVNQHLQKFVDEVVDPLSDETHFVLAAFPQRVEKQKGLLAEMNTMTLPIAYVWKNKLECIEDDSIDYKLKNATCELGCLLKIALNYFERIKSASIFACNYGSEFPHITERDINLATWVSQQLENDRHNWIARYLPGITPPPSLRNSIDLSKIPLEHSIVVQNKYLVTFEQIFEYTRSYMDENLDEKELKIIFDPNTKSELSKNEIEMLGKKIPVATECFQLLNKAISEPPVINTNKELLNFIYMLLDLSSTETNDPNANNNANVLSKKEYNATYAATLAVMLLSLWLDLLKADFEKNQNPAFYDLIKESEFKTILKRLNITKYYDDAVVDEHAVDGINCTNGTKSLLKIFINSYDNNIRIIFEKSIIGKESIYNLLNSNPKYMRNNKHLNDAHQKLLEWKSAFVVNQTAIFSQNPVELMASLRDDLKYLSKETQQSVIQYYRNTLTNPSISVNFVNLKSLTHLESLNRLVDYQLTLKSLSQQKTYYPALNIKSKEYELKTFQFTAELLLHINSEIKKINDAVLATLNGKHQELVNITNKKYDNLYKLADFVRFIISDLLVDCEFETLIDNQTTRMIAKNILERFAIHINLLLTELNINSTISDIDSFDNIISFITKTFKPLIKHIVQRYLPLLEIVEQCAKEHLVENLFKIIEENYSYKYVINDFEYFIRPVNNLIEAAYFAIILFDFAKANAFKGIKSDYFSIECLSIFNNRITLTSHEADTILVFKQNIPNVNCLMRSGFKAAKHPKTARLLVMLKTYLESLPRDVVAQKEELSDLIYDFLDKLNRDNKLELTDDELIKKAIIAIVSPNMEIPELIWNTSYLLNKYQTIYKPNHAIARLQNAKRLLKPFLNKSIYYLDNATGSYTKKEFKLASALDAHIDTLLSNCKYDDIEIEQINKSVLLMEELYKSYEALDIDKIIENSSDPLCKSYCDHFCFNAPNISTMRMVDLIFTDRLGSKILNEDLIPIAKIINTKYLPQINTNKNKSGDVKKFMPVINTFKYRPESISEFDTELDSYLKIKKFACLYYDIKAFLTNNNHPIFRNQVQTVDLALNDLKQSSNRKISHHPSEFISNTDYILNFNIDMEQHASTLPILMFIKVYQERIYERKNRSNFVSDDYWKYSKIINAMSEIDTVIAFHSKLPREQLFTKIIHALAPAIVYKTGNHWRSQTYGETALWQILSPILTEKEKLILHAEFTAARLEYIHDNSTNTNKRYLAEHKAKAIREDIKNIVNSNNDNDYEQHRSTLLTHYADRRNRYFSKLPLATTSIRSYRKLFPKK